MANVFPWAWIKYRNPSNLDWQRFGSLETGEIAPSEFELSGPLQSIEPLNGNGEANGYIGFYDPAVHQKRYWKNNEGTIFEMTSKQMYFRPPYADISMHDWEDPNYIGTMYQPEPEPEPEPEPGDPTAPYSLEEGPETYRAPMGGSVVTLDIPGVKEVLFGIATLRDCNHTPLMGYSPGLNRITELTNMPWRCEGISACMIIPGPNGSAFVNYGPESGGYPDSQGGSRLFYKQITNFGDLTSSFNMETFDYSGDWASCYYDPISGKQFVGHGRSGRDGKVRMYDNGWNNWVVDVPGYPTSMWVDGDYLWVTTAANGDNLVKIHIPTKNKEITMGLWEWSYARIADQDNVGVLFATIDCPKWFPKSRPWEMHDTEFYKPDGSGYRRASNSELEGWYGAACYHPRTGKFVVFLTGDKNNLNNLGVYEMRMDGDTPKFYQIAWYENVGNWSAGCAPIDDMIVFITGKPGYDPDLSPGKIWLLK